MIVGFTQGTFDMFHIGHLNLLRNAKEQCDYLIVGINSDELVERYKGKKVIIPLDERKEIVSAIKYVDEVLVCDTLDKMTTFNAIPFNKLFIGDDWKGAARWNETETIMGKVGVTVIYLPHTDGTSSTMLRKKLENK